VGSGHISTYGIGEGSESCCMPKAEPSLLGLSQLDGYFELLQTRISFTDFIRWSWTQVVEKSIRYELSNRCTKAI
jgi:hypothetical protein